MKEVFTKSFWQGVKKTFHEACEDLTPTANALQTPIEGDTSASSTLATPLSPSVPTGNQRNYSLISVTCTGTNNGTTVEGRFT